MNRLLLGAVLALSSPLVLALDLIPPDIQSVASTPATQAPAAKADKPAPVDDSIRPPPKGDKGYWFYHNHTKKPEIKPPLIEAKKPKKKECQDPKTWNVTCGFVLPTSFEMQAMERDALIRNMAMHPEKPESVLAVQKYMRWVLHQAFYASNVWEHNALKNPELNASATSPISRLGQRMASSLDQGKRDLVWDAIRQAGGILIVFTKHDCDFCHSQYIPLRILASHTGLEVWDASIGGKCLDQYIKKNRCVGTEKSILPAKLLKISVVPTTLLYIPDGVWIRVGSGLTTTDVLESRLYNLFISWKVAAAGIGKATGNTGLALDPDAAPQDSQALMKILKASIAKGAEK